MEGQGSSHVDRTGRKVDLNENGQEVGHVAWKLISSQFHGRRDILSSLPSHTTFGISLEQLSIVNLVVPCPASWRCNQYVGVTTWAALLALNEAPPTSLL